MPSDHRDEHYGNKPRSMKHFETFEWCHRHRPTQGCTFSPHPLRRQARPPHPQQGVPVLLHEITDITELLKAFAKSPGLPGYQKQCFKRMDNLERVKGRRKGRVSSQKLTPNLEEKSPKGSTATWKIKRGSILSPDTQILLPQEPQPVRHQAPRQELLRWHPTSSITPETTLTSDKGSDLTPRPGSHQAGPGLGPPLHTTLGQSCQARGAKFSIHKTRPHPHAGWQPSEKKGGC